jgi:redox-sensitive bicupin YhaK (pirin superfamily)
VTVNQDVDLYAVLLKAGDETAHHLMDGRHAWLQVVKGSVLVNGRRLEEGDGGAVSGEDRLLVKAEALSRVLLFDLA